MQFFSRLILWLVVTSGFCASSVLSQDAPTGSQSFNSDQAKSAHVSSARGLNNSVSLMLSEHPQLKSLLGELYIQMSEIDEKESAFLPQLSLSLGIGREYSDNTSTRAFTGQGSEHLERREAGLSLRQMLFDGFRSHWERESGIELGQAQRFTVISQAELLAFEAIRSHLFVMRENLALKDHILNLKTHERIAQNVSMRARLGKDDRAKVSQISARLSLSLANVESAKGKLRVAEADYSRVVGVEPGKSLTFNPGLVAMPESLESLLKDVMDLNPELLSENRRLRASKADRQAANSTDFPSLYFESGASWNDNLDGVKGRNEDAYVMFRMQYDLFNGGRDSVLQSRASRQVSQVEYQLEDIKRELTMLTEQAWYSYQSLSTRVNLLQDYVESAENTKNAYIKQFDIGQRSLIDLLDAENELLKAKRLRNEARYDLYLVKYNLLRLQGKLLDHLSERVAIAPKVVQFLKEEE